MRQHRKLEKKRYWTREGKKMSPGEGIQGEKIKLKCQKARMTNRETERMQNENAEREKKT